MIFTIIIFLEYLVNKYYLKNTLFEILNIIILYSLSNILSNILSNNTIIKIITVYFIYEFFNYFLKILFILFLILFFINIFYNIILKKESFCKKNNINT